MRRLLGLIMLLAIISTARGQTAYSYRYWFDNNLATLQTGAANGETTVEVDISGLAKGSVHTLHFQGIDAREMWSPVHTQYFFIAKEADIETTTARYWFDNDETTVQTAPTIDGLIDLDISHMDIGTHAIHYQTFNAAGEASPVRTQYFYMGELQRPTLSCKIWIDDDENNAQIYPLTDDDIVIDAENWPVGTHDLHVTLFDSKGVWLAESTTTFEVPIPTETITLNALGKGTYCSESPLNFTNVSGIYAYIVSGFKPSAGNLIVTRVYEVPAGTGFYIAGTPGNTYNVPIESTDFYYSNMMKGVLVPTVIPANEDGYTNYVLSSDGHGGVMFKHANNASLQANRAYVQVPSSTAGAREFLGIETDDDSITGLDGVITPNTQEAEGDYYNLSGQKVQTPQKGIYIKNGKKIIIY